MTVPSPSVEAAAHFPLEGTSAGAARRFVGTTLDGWGLGELEDVARLLVSELVSNVVLHAETELDVLLRLSGSVVRIEVHDRNPRLPERKHYSATSATGRGLLLLAELATSWGVEVTPGGKAVWFELDDAAAPAAATHDAGADLRLEDWEDWDDLVQTTGPDDPHSGSSATAGGHHPSLRGSHALMGAP